MKRKMDSHSEDQANGCNEQTEDRLTQLQQARDNLPAPFQIVAAMIWRGGKEEALGLLSPLDPQFSPSTLPNRGCNDAKEDRGRERIREEQGAVREEQGS